MASFTQDDQATLKALGAEYYARVGVIALEMPDPSTHCANCPHPRENHHVEQRRACGCRPGSENYGRCINADECSCPGWLETISSGDRFKLKQADYLPGPDIAAEVVAPALSLGDLLGCMCPTCLARKASK